MSICSKICGKNSSYVKNKKSQPFCSSIFFFLGPLFCNKAEENFPPPSAIKSRKLEHLSLPHIFSSHENKRINTGDITTWLQEETDLNVFLLLILILSFSFHFGETEYRRLCSVLIYIYQMGRETWVNLSAFDVPWGHVTLFCGQEKPVWMEEKTLRYAQTGGRARRRRSSFN